MPRGDGKGNVREVSEKTRDFRSEVAHFFGKVPRFPLPEADRETMVAHGGTKKLPPHRCGWGGSEVNVPADGVGMGISLGVRRVCARCGRE